MSLPHELADLLHGAAYRHPCDAIELVETHISWVLLTGRYAYKLKKPVRFPFVDFSTLAQRAHFCREELRCNRAFAPSLYLDVVPVTREAADGRLRMGGEGEAVEWAVQMRQFPPEAQLDRLLERGALAADELRGFGVSLATRHADQPARRLDAESLEPRVLGPARENFADLLALPWIDPHRPLLERLRRGCDTEAERHRALLVKRLESGWIRECHGDLHLSNLVRLDDTVLAFDCLEFNPNLRWIDPQSDVAFLFMDCLVRQRSDLAYAFVDGYLDQSGDYDGARLLRFYAAYRSMVRAKVAALRRDQAPPAEARQHEQRFLEHARWTDAWLGRPPGRLVLMCGLSGSGKSYLARRLAPRLPALRLRSDVVRKRLAGIDPRSSARAAVGAGLYARERTEAVYRRLRALARDLLTAGEHVIVDATFLSAADRRPFAELAAELGQTVRVVWCDAPAAVLRERVTARSAAGGDPSDADLAVLEAQMGRFDPPDGAALRVDMAGPLSPERLERLARALRGPGPGAAPGD
jgi:hypothetical protein